MIDDTTLEQLIKYSNGPLAVLFACLLLQKRHDYTYITEENLAHITGRTDKTIRGHMHQLAIIGFATHTTHGWILTTLGRMQLLEVAQIEPNNSDFLLNGTGNLPVKVTGDLPDEDLKTGKLATNGTPPVKITGDESVVVVLKDLKDLKDLKTQQQQKENLPVKITGDFEIDRSLKIGEQLCQTAKIVLGDEIWPDKVLSWLKDYETRRKYHPENTLKGLTIITSWIAQLHDSPPDNVSSSLSAIVAANVTRNRKPLTKYLENCWEYLPDEFIDQMSVCAQTLEDELA